MPNTNDSCGISAANALDTINRQDSLSAANRFLYAKPTTSSLLQEKLYEVILKYVV